ncbi:HAD-IIIA family hydrolase [Cellulomonas hominis]|uniref:HAD-IIIA family hydrolase n=1 Tax=Cellulomonas hominis TaxID=156981 RepID=UPI001BA3422B|nr:HAD-IIIA family hydrolase [Cellulomonas hominis]VTR78823.1 D-glycero-beta-D-manno-heptose-1,7-bisphosphate 7-phosphatase [Cellulomonas hominis]
MTGPRWSVVVPTIGRPQLRAMLGSLAAQPFDAHRSDALPAPEAVVVVDDRPLTDTTPLDLADLGPLPAPLRVLRSGGRGPAAARNAGWRSTRTPWVAFLDDDVLLPEGWADAFAADLAAAGPDVAATQARLHVPLPAHRPPLDWERSTAGLEGARWATADMAFRRAALEQAGGFDERFPRAYREDSDLALRVRLAGWQLTRGSRTTTHPVRPADDRVSVRVQAGAADDALMRALHGPGWRELAETGRGRFRWHVATVAAAGLAAGAALTGHRRPAALAGAGWLALTADFARRRIAPGPRPGQPDWAPEWRRMAWTSAVIPFVAVRHRLRGTLAHRGGVDPWPVPVRAVLLDRDGTLVHDVPYNGDPAQVRPVDGAREVLDALRAAGIAVGLVSNQSGVARGVLTRAQVDAVNARLAELVGPFGTVQVCPHGPDDGCTCRKPAPGMVLAAARALGVPPAACAVVGDIGADVDAAVAAGARAVLVPTPATRPEEVEAAPEVAPDLWSAVARLVPGVLPPRHRREEPAPDGADSEAEGAAA